MVYCMALLLAHETAHKGYIFQDILTNLQPTRSRPIHDPRIMVLQPREFFFNNRSLLQYRKGSLQ